MALERLKHRSLADTTHETYHSAWCSFNDFVIKLNATPDRWEDRLILFVVFLIDKKHLPSAIKTYTSAIKSVLQEDGVETNLDSFILASLLKACKYVDREMFSPGFLSRRGC